MEIERRIELSNKYGLHARASTRLSELAKKFNASILISKPDAEGEVDAKSILGVLTLGIAKGQPLDIRVVGENAQDAEEAMKAIVELIERKFDED